MTQISTDFLGSALLKFATSQIRQNDDLWNPCNLSFLEERDRSVTP